MSAFTPTGVSVCMETHTHTQVHAPAGDALYHFGHAHCVRAVRDGAVHHRGARTQRTELAA